MKTVDKSRITCIYKLSEVCNEFGLKRDAFYKYQKRYMQREHENQRVLNLIHQRRKKLPREGCRKLHNALQDKFAEQNLKVGRDRLFNIL